MLRVKVANFIAAMGQSCYGSKLLRVKVATGSKLLRVKVATYKIAMPIKWVKVANRQKKCWKICEILPKTFCWGKKKKNPPVRRPWFTFSSVGPLKAARLLQSKLATLQSCLFSKMLLYINVSKLLFCIYATNLLCYKVDI